MEKNEEEDVIKTLSNLNLNFSDFVFKEMDMTNHQANAVYAISGEIEITYNPSKISKKYKTGHGSSWPAEFEFDIKTNFYRTRQ